MNIHVPTPSLLEHVCASCGTRDSDPTYHRTAVVATVSPLRESAGTTLYCGDNCNHTGPHRYPPEPVAVARRTDPSTSWEAARSVTRLTAKQDEVHELFLFGGPMTDEEAAGRYSSLPDTEGQSPSGLRTRRSELVARGLLRDTGERRRGSTGRRMIVWAAT